MRGSDIASLLVEAGLALLIAAASAAAAPEATSPRRQFEDVGPISSAEARSDGSLVFNLWEERVRYRIPRQSEVAARPLADIFRKAREGKLALKVRFDAAGGRIDPLTGTIEYGVCGVEAGGEQAEPQPGCAPDGPVTASGEKALALAYGFDSIGDFAAAGRLIEAAGEEGPSGYRKVLLWLRARNAERRAALETSRSEAADRLDIEALGHYRALAAAEPNDQEHQFSIAALLIDLGGYAEAEAVLDAIVAKWPDEKFRVLIRKAALSRLQGRYPEALATLDRLVAELGPQDGMRYHYHRGWTLSLMGRHAEAIAEYGEGLKSQPDYPSVFERRACSYAALGRLAEASSDLDRARALLAALPGGTEARAIAKQIAAIEAERRKVASAPAGSRVQGLCAGPNWDELDHPRARSPRLPPG